jgi:hypothetical protein
MGERKKGRAEQPIARGSLVDESLCCLIFSVMCEVRSKPSKKQVKNLSHGNTPVHRERDRDNNRGFF